MSQEVTKADRYAEKTLQRSPCKFYIGYDDPFYHSKCSALRQEENASKIQNDGFVKILKHACPLNLHNIRVKVPPE